MAKRVQGKESTDKPTRTPPGSAPRRKSPGTPTVESRTDSTKTFTSAPPSTETNLSDVESALGALETRFHELQKQIQQLQRMASIGTMAAILAHEFNNLLTPIQTYSQYALKRDDPGLLRTAVERSHKSSQRLAVLCRRILGMASNASGNAVELSARELLQDSIEMVGRDFQKDSIAVTIDAPEDLKVRAEPGAIQQVLFNLVINAWQAMLDKPGRLSLVARRIDFKHVALCVSDTGTGIKPEDQAKIFNPFFTTKSGEAKSYRRGTGLGLHVCKQLVEEHGGRIKVESQWGSGTTVTIMLPA